MKPSEALLEVLLEVREVGPRLEDGICGNLCPGLLKFPGPLIKGACDLLADLFAAWPEYSGVRAYPVPCPHGDDPADAYQDAGSLWEGEYGAARRRLLDFCIASLEEGKDG